MRGAFLNKHLFDGLRHARNLVAAWRNDFNHHRLHSSLAGLTPAEYVNQLKKIKQEQSEPVETDSQESRSPC